MQVEVDVKCMQTNFGGHGLSGFRVMAPFCFPSKRPKISLQTKIESAQKIHAKWVAKISFNFNFS